MPTIPNESAYSLGANYLFNLAEASNLDTPLIRIQTKEILISLWKNDDLWVEIYEIHKKYRTSPRHLAFIIEWLINQNIIVLNETENSLKLTLPGRKWVFDNRKDLFLKPLRDKPWLRTKELHTPPRSLRMATGTEASP
jgi:hypothetical protein